MPLVVFGDGMKEKSHVKFKGKRVGVSEIIFKHLKRREKLGEVFVLDIDEFRTSSVSHFNVILSLYIFKCSSMICIGV